MRNVTPTQSEANITPLGLWCLGIVIAFLLHPWTAVAGEIGVQNSLSRGGLISSVAARPGTVWTWSDDDVPPKPKVVVGIDDAVAVTAGVSHKLALTADGTVWAWGSNWLGQLGDGTKEARTTPVQPKGLERVVAIAAGGNHSLALKSDGTVWTWGTDYTSDSPIHEPAETFTIPVRVEGLEEVVAIAAGTAHSLALKSDGTVWAWGYGVCGVLGDGTYVSRSAPGKVAVLSDITAFAANSRSVALKSDGTVWVWPPESLPYDCYMHPPAWAAEPVAGLSDIVTVAAGAGHMLALRFDGTVYAWGYNHYDQVGCGQVECPEPYLVAFPTDAVAIGGSGERSAAIDNKGLLWLWGGNWDKHFSPSVLDGIEGVSAVVGGRDHMVAIADNVPRSETIFVVAVDKIGSGTGTVESSPAGISCGDNCRGEFAAGETVVLTATPDDGHVFAGWSGGWCAGVDPCTLTMKNDVTVVASFEPIHCAYSVVPSEETFPAGGGVGTIQVTATPVQCAWTASTDVPWIIILSGGEGTGSGTLVYQLLSNDSIEERRGVLRVGGAKLSVTQAGVTSFSVAVTRIGSGSGTVTSTPEGIDCGDKCLARYASGTVVTLTAVSAPGTAFKGWQGACSGDGTCVLDGTKDAEVVALFAEKTTVWSWGKNYSQQLGDGTSENRSSPVRTGGVTGMVAVAAGGSHTVSLKSDTTLWGWGSDVYGQLGDGLSGLTTGVPVQSLDAAVVAAVAAGGNHTLALASDGTVRARGDNWYGQLGDGTTQMRTTPVPVSELVDIIAVAAGGNHSLALKSDGTVQAWGANFAGQLGDGTTQMRTLPVAIGGLAGVAAISAGGVHSLALASDGTVRQWGTVYAGRPEATEEIWMTPVLVEGLTGIRAVAAGWHHSLALASDGTVWSWGYNWYGQLGDGTALHRAAPLPVAGLNEVFAIAAGSGHSVALTTQMTIDPYRLGVQKSGKGKGVVTSSPSGIDCGGACEASFALGTEVILTAQPDSESVFAGWGDNAPKGPLTVQMYGNRVVTARFEPCAFGVGSSDAVSPVEGGAGIVMVTATAPHCAWTASTDVDWITITEGQSGAGDGELRYTVAPNPDVAARKGTVTVAGLVVAVRQEGISLPLLAVRLMGTGLGEVVSDPPGIDCGFTCGAYFAEGTIVVLTATPGKENIFTGWGGACSGTGACSVKMDSRNAVMAFFERIDERTVYDWSYQRSSSGRWSGLAPTAVKGLSNVTALASEGNGAITSDGRIWEWDLFYDPRAYPRMDLNRVIAFSSRVDDGLALKSDGTVWQWKDGEGGFVSQQVEGLADIVAVADGGYHFLALKSDGTVWSWGYNGDGQLGDNTDISRSTPGKVLNLSKVIAISAAGYTSLALKSDGTVWAWGLYSAGHIYQKNTKSLFPVRLFALNGIVAISAGGDLHSLALASDGTVWAWGMNTYGELGDGTTGFRTGPGKVGGGLTDVIAIAAGGDHSLALKSDGTVWAWGHNWYGGTGNNPYEDSLLPRQVPGLDHIKAITANGGRSVALRTTRRLTLTVKKAGSGIGTVTGTPGGIDCGETCSATYDDGTTVTLTATPENGYYLASWSKPCGKGNTCTITLDNSTEVTATFEPIPPCTYTVKPTEKSFPAKGGNISVNVTGTGDYCVAPELYPSAPWITAENISFSNNKGRVKVSVPENGSSLKRTGTVSIGNALLSVTQQGSPCKIVSLTPSTASYTATGGGGTFAVSTPEGCSWTAAPEKGSSSWMAVTSGATGTGPGSVSYTVDSNTTTKNKTGKITVILAGASGRKTFTVRQQK